MNLLSTTMTVVDLQKQQQGSHKSTTRQPQCSHKAATQLVIQAASSAQQVCFVLSSGVQAAAPLHLVKHTRVSTRSGWQCWSDTHLHSSFWTSGKCRQHARYTGGCLLATSALPQAGKPSDLAVVFRVRRALPLRQPTRHLPVSTNPTNLPTPPNYTTSM